MPSAIHKAKALIVGTGAIGCLYGWRLSKSASVSTVCRSNFEAVKRNGFNIQSQKWGDGVFKPHQVLKNTKEAIQDKYDYVVITTKALPDIYDVAELIRPAISSESTAIVLIQNGLDIETPIAKAFPCNPLISSVAYIAASQESAGNIVMSQDENLVLSQYLPTSIGDDKLNNFMDLLSAGNVTAKHVPDIQRIRWEKLIWNASFSSVCVATGMTTTQVLAHPPSAKLVENIMRDVIKAANSYGCNFDADAEVSNMIARTMAIANNYKPSMMLDSERKNPMEVEVILGNPVRRAETNNVSVPYLQSIYTVCSAINDRNLGRK
ncbi:hypothetical protein INT43_006743 [Umbelopsis isabellina]|uniref:2-dehydropantoate 2-reductase n=1 Tax=Mortierella isabellina TaxID=91625 RepID=A0A8H7Q0A9_MORIS|nr:hypothetical protein INT43_006743 [Umbelopsis isabellina]